MKVRIDRSKCTGCGLCVNIAGEVFEIREGACCFRGEEPKQIMEKEIPEELAKKVEEAINSCPMGAISKL